MRRKPLLIGTILLFLGFIALAGTPNVWVNLRQVEPFRSIYAWANPKKPAAAAVPVPVAAAAPLGIAPPEHKVQYLGLADPNPVAKPLEVQPTPAPTAPAPDTKQPQQKS